jgi:hypothetical protein
MIELTPVAVLQKRMIQARRNGIRYLRRRIESLERSRAGGAAFFPFFRASQRGDSSRKRLPMTNRMPGGRETQKM